MLNNKEVVDAFAEGIPARSSNLWVSCDGKRLFSYETCIAQRMGKEVVMNATKYSPTTSRHQYLVSRRFKGCLQLTGFDRGTYSLYPSYLAWKRKVRAEQAEYKKVGGEA